MRVFFRLVVRQIVLYGLSYVENPYACYYFIRSYSCSENEKKKVR